MYRAALAAVAVITASPAAANDFAPAMSAYLEAEISSWAHSQVLIDAISAQNARTGAYDQPRIDALDTAWREEVGTSETPTVTPVMENAAADFLRNRVDISAGQITEVFIMDARGLNVAASALTSDMWQGDEAKFTKTFSAGPDAVHFSEVELDDSTQRYQGQISLTITDPESGAPIGAMTVGVDAEALM